MHPIIAYHVSFTAYGFWLPNDPRGSWSDAVWAPRLVRFGEPIPARTRRSLAHDSHDMHLRRAAKAELKYPAVRFDGIQARAVARGLAEVVETFQLPVYAAAVMPDHVHVVLARHRQKAEEWVGYFKRAASRRLRNEAVHPFARYMQPDGRLPTPWTAGGWKIFLHDEAEIRRNVHYVEQNPIKADLRPQQWSFVTPFDRR